MNLFELAPSWLAWVLAALLLAAAGEDAVRLKISNLLCLSVLLAAIAAMVISGFEADVWQNLLVFAALLAGGTFLFGRGLFGGGDVKLLAALGLWCNLGAAVAMLSGVFISGGILAIVVLAVRTFAPAAAAERIVILKPKGGIPYGVAIAAGGLLSLALYRG